MTTSPERASQAIGYLENGQYRTYLQNAAIELEIGFEINGEAGAEIYRFWRDQERTGTGFADFATSQRNVAEAFLMGIAFTVQGEWTP